ncbi:MAG: SDR family oxidoreductase [Planctomycetota bacterium]
MALVTGGAKRVGRATTERLAGRGYRVAIHANSSAAAADELAGTIRGNGGDAATFVADLSDEAATRALVDAAAERFGRLDAVVHCAAIWSPTPLEEVTAADVRRNLEVNTVGAFVVAQHAGLRMCGQESGGAIVLFGDAACERPQTGYAAYHPSKGAIPAMTRSLAVELAERNAAVRINAVLPGPVLASPDEPEERRRHVAEGVLVDTVGDAAHLAEAALHLIENKFVTGVCLPVEGGRLLDGGW